MKNGMMRMIHDTKPGESGVGLQAGNLTCSGKRPTQPRNHKKAPQKATI